MEEEGIFYERVKALSQGLGKSFNQIEKDLNYPRNALNNYKNCRTPSGIRLIELAEYFGVSAEYLIGKNNISGIESIELMFNKMTVNQKREIFHVSQNWVLCEAKKG